MIERFPSDENKEFESYLDFNSKNDFENIIISEENTNNQNQSNQKIRFIRRNSDKNKDKDKNKLKIFNEHGKNENIDIKKNSTEICCSENIKEKCIIF